MHDDGHNWGDAAGIMVPAPGGLGRPAGETSEDRPERIHSSNAMELSGVGANGVGGNLRFPTYIYLKFTNPMNTNPI